MEFALLLTAFAALGGWIYFALWHGGFWRPLLPPPAPEPPFWPAVDIIVPARNEADTLPRTLPSLLQQNYPGDYRVILVDDHSGDGTAAVAQRIATAVGKPDRLSVIAAPELKPGWTGKVAAMQAGVARSNASMLLFTDADIRHAPYSLRRLVARIEAGNLDLVSRMVRLNCASVAEKLLIPAFVFFFAMLYPFRRANDPASHVAAAAGGTMLVRRAALNKIGGLSAVKGALIDDCSLAKAIKDAGGRTELTLTRHIESLRPYPHIRNIWSMVSRCAYTQLRHSVLLLICTVIGLQILCVMPPLLTFAAPSRDALAAAVLGWLTMTMLYLPIVEFYGLQKLWALTLPLAALVYIGATLDSARLYRQGKGGAWKGRTHT